MPSDYKINVTAIKNALNSLQNAYDEYNKTHNEYVRDSVIQRFKYTYALAVSFIQRYIELNIPNQQDLNPLTFNSMIRQANQMGILLNDLENDFLKSIKKDFIQLEI